MRVGPLVTVIGTVLLAFLLAGCEPGSFLSDEEGEEGSDQHGAGEAPRQEQDSVERNVIEDDVLVVVDDGSQVGGQCEGREVVVTADDAQVVLDGTCGMVRAAGRGSTVEVGSADKIVLVGVDNTVSYGSGDPEVVNRGRDTTVHQGGSAAG
ncbi:DUF3060 domain-containing protein [Nocardiopsis xinjiangensis]|uniref:DUF3060 domain-containing protein n=1 Tax=Nocardiopsis xinjiangensis TaxID=124285 RepID=UPI0003460BA2|nr:DUF3060 domain-containing protein [Nocardiopsis xinjiangensis]